MTKKRAGIALFLVAVVSFHNTMYRNTKTVERCQCCQQRVSLTDSHCSTNFFWYNHTTEVVDSTDYTRHFITHKNLLVLQICTVSICKTRRFILLSCYILIIKLIESLRPSDSEIKPQCTNSKSKKHNKGCSVAAR